MTQASAAPRGRLRRVVTDVVVAIAVTAAAILALEGAASAALFISGMRETHAPNPLRRARTSPDTLLGWLNERSASRPDAYGKGVGLFTTAEGFRRKTSSETARGGAAPNTIACSGDSYTLGYGVRGDQTWCALLEQALPNMQTINLGQEAYGLDQTYLLYRSEAAQTSNALQILTVTSVSLERAASRDDAGWPKPQLKVDQGTVTTGGVPGNAAAAEYRRSAIGRLWGEVRLVQALRRVPAFNPDVDRRHAVDANRPVIEQLIADLQKQHHAAGTRLLVVYLPMYGEIADTTLDERRTWLADVAKRHDVAFADLTPALRAVPRDSSDLAFFARWSPVVPPGATGQLSPMGHAWVARMLAPSVAPLLRSSPRTAAAR
jgi:hypothetical protein